MSMALCCDQHRLTETHQAKNATLAVIVGPDWPQEDDPHGALTAQCCDQHSCVGAAAPSCFGCASGESQAATCCRYGGHICVHCAACMPLLA
jgi:hypothetical protein